MPKGLFHIELPNHHKQLERVEVGIASIVFSIPSWQRAGDAD